ncbi:Hpt domain-containing protein [Loktanella fryxellensis]|uniref:Hpt domain-containing protein n=1 Tax=Loktanella fryxellensis TaxID=245187 RepID=A0A1H8ECJ2_9RHOB|nr:Hpt domain-containing protein [Loktanella fryxellensis]SEN17232.1 Hpt domain-containing protein [Loktanella fryxellensis]
MTRTAGSDADFDAGMLRLKQRFLQHHFERHEQLEALLEDWRRGEDAGSGPGIAEAVLHKIAGAAGSLGLQTLGDAAFVAERHLRDQRRSDRIDLTAAANVLDAFLEVSLQVCRDDRTASAYPMTDRSVGCAGR